MVVGEEREYINPLKEVTDIDTEERNMIGSKYGQFPDQFARVRFVQG